MTTNSGSITAAPIAKGDVPTHVGRKLAALAGVPVEEQDSFSDLIRLAVRLVWERDRRAFGASAGEGLKRAANAARALHEALGDLETVDREWVERLRDRTPWYKHWFGETAGAAFQLAHLLSVAAGKAPPPSPSENSRPNRKGRRKGSVGDVIFLDFVRFLLVVTTESKGDLKVENECGTGSLIDALDILRPYLPKKFVPIVPPAGTLQRIRANRDDYFTPLNDIDIFHLSNDEQSSPTKIKK